MSALKQDNERLTKHLSDSNARLESTNLELQQLDLNHLHFQKSKNIAINELEKKNIELVTKCRKLEHVEQDNHNVRNTLSIVEDQKMEMTNTMETLMASLASSEERNETLHNNMQLFQQELTESEQMIQKYKYQQEKEEGEEGEEGEHGEHGEQSSGTNGMDEMEGMEGMESMDADLVSRLRSFMYTMTSSKHSETKLIKELKMLKKQRIIEMKELQEKVTKHVQVTLQAKEEEHLQKMQELEQELEQHSMKQTEKHNHNIMLNALSKDTLASKNKIIQNLELEKKNITAEYISKVNVLNEELKQEQMRKEDGKREVQELTVQLKLASEMEAELQSMMEEKDKEMEQLQHQLKKSNEQVTHQTEWESTHVISSILDTVIEQTVYDSNQDQRNALQQVTLENESLRLLVQDYKQKVRSYSVTSKEAEENLRLLVEEMKHTINSAQSEIKTTENNCNTKIDQLTKQHLVLMKEKNKMLIHIQQQN